MTSSAFLTLVDDAKSRIKEIDIRTLKRWQTEQKSFYLLDVREAHESAQGMIEGAHPLSKGIIEAQIERLLPDKTACIILYCSGGYRSALAADNLQKMGYSHVYSLIGGYTAWKA